MTWRLANALTTLRAEVDTRWPGRAKTSDGTIGDAAHQARDSDHNPWVRDGSVGVVTAIDLTDDTIAGVQVADEIARVLVARRDPRIKYVIHDHRIWRSYDKPGIPAWTPAKYTGSNQHASHVHVSVQPDQARYDDPGRWGIQPAAGAGTAPAAVKPARRALRRWRVLARDTTGPHKDRVTRVYRTRAGGYTRDPHHPNIAKTRPQTFTRSQARRAEPWGKTRGLAIHTTKSKHPFLVLDTDTAWGKRDLSRSLDHLGETLERYLWVGEFKRPKRRQHAFRMAYLRRDRGANLAANCNRVWTGMHTWAQCLVGGPSQSNHATGDAADVSVLHSGRSGAYTNVGLFPGARAAMRKLRLCLPVPRELWHVQRGEDWAN